MGNGIFSKVKGGIGVNKSELIKSVAKKAALSQKDTAKVLETLLEIVQKALVNGEKVQIIGFGSFEVRDRKERKVITPTTREEMILPATKVPAFKPGKALKEAVVSSKKKTAKKK